MNPNASTGRELYSTPDDPMRQYWVLEDKIAGFRFLTLSERELQEFADRAGRNFATPQAARELDDVELRLKHMDELGIDVQVLHNTFWIEQVTTKRPESRSPFAAVGTVGSPTSRKKAAAGLFYSCVVPAMDSTQQSTKSSLPKKTAASRCACAPSKATAIYPIPYFYPIYQPPAISTWRSPCISPTATRQTPIFTAKRQPAASHNSACRRSPPVSMSS